MLKISLFLWRILILTCLAAEAYAATVRVDINDLPSDRYFAAAIIKNDESEPVKNWRLEFDLDGEISHIWNAEIISRAGGHYVIAGKNHHADLAPFKRLIIGFAGYSAAAPPAAGNVMFYGDYSCSRPSACGGTPEYQRRIHRYTELSNLTNTAFNLPMTMQHPPTGLAHRRLKRWDFAQGAIPVKTKQVAAVEEALDIIEQKLRLPVFDRNSLANVPDEQVETGIVVTDSNMHMAFDALCPSIGLENTVLPLSRSGIPFDENGVISMKALLGVSGPDCSATVDEIISRITLAMGLAGSFSTQQQMGTDFWNVLRTLYRNDIGATADRIVAVAAEKPDTKPWWDAEPPLVSKSPRRPVITLRGKRVVNHPLGSPYHDKGATAKDGHKDISRRIKVYGAEEVNVHEAGDYLVRYQVTDRHGLPADEAVRIVRVNSGDFTRQSKRVLGSTDVHVGYWEHLPPDYSADPGRKHPLILFVHGSGGYAQFFPDSNAGLNALASGGDIADIIDKGEWDGTRPFIVLSPQFKDLFAFDVDSVQAFYKYALNTYNIDTSRVYVVTASLGSWLASQWMIEYPGQVTAMVTVSGLTQWTFLENRACLFADTPVWAFHAADDVVVPLDRFNLLYFAGMPVDPNDPIFGSLTMFSGSRDTVSLLNQCNRSEQAKLTLYPDGGHAVTRSTYDLSALGDGLPEYDIYDESIYDWFLRYTRH